MMWKPVGECVLQACSTQGRRAELCASALQSNHHIFIHISCSVGTSSYFCHYFFPACFIHLHFLFCFLPSFRLYFIISSIFPSLIFPSFLPSFSSSSPISLSVSVMKTWSAAAENRSKFPYCSWLHQHMQSCSLSLSLKKRHDITNSCPAAWKNACLVYIHNCVCGCMWASVCVHGWGVWDCQLPR